MLKPNERHRAKHPIQLCIAGDGRVVHLTPWNIRNFMESLSAANPVPKYLTSLFAFPWMRNSLNNESDWDRLKRYKNLTCLQIARVEKQANHLLARGKLHLSQRPKEIQLSSVPTRGRRGFRKAWMLPFNGLALELLDLGHDQVIDLQQETIAVTADDEHGSFKLLRLHGLKTEGPLSDRRLTYVVSSFYDRSYEYRFDISDMQSRRWYKVVEIGAMDGFSIVSVGTASEQRYQRTLTMVRALNAKTPRICPRTTTQPKPKVELSSPTNRWSQSKINRNRPNKRFVSETKRQGAGQTRSTNQITNIEIWASLSNGQISPRYYSGAPQHFASWVKVTEQGFRNEFRNIELQAWQLAETILANNEVVTSDTESSPYYDIARMMLEDRPYENTIWQLLRPNVTKSLVSTWPG